MHDAINHFHPVAKIAEQMFLFFLRFELRFVFARCRKLEAYSALGLMVVG
jgi:hypothetical protein